MTPNQYTFRYRVRNWSDYNRALIARGRLTFWFDEDAVSAWRNADPPKGPGAPKVYSDTAALLHNSGRVTDRSQSCLNAIEFALTQACAGLTYDSVPHI